MAADSLTPNQTAHLSGPVNPSLTANIGQRFSQVALPCGRSRTSNAAACEIAWAGRISKPFGVRFCPRRRAYGLPTDCRFCCDGDRSGDRSRERNTAVTNRGSSAGEAPVESVTTQAQPAHGYQLLLVAPLFAVLVKNTETCPSPGCTIRAHVQRTRHEIHRRRTGPNAQRPLVVVQRPHQRPVGKHILVRPERRDRQRRCVDPPLPRPAVAVPRIQREQDLRTQRIRRRVLQLDVKVVAIGRPAPVDRALPHPDLEARPDADPTAT